MLNNDVITMNMISLTVKFSWYVLFKLLSIFPGDTLIDIAEKFGGIKFGGLAVQLLI